MTRSQGTDSRLELLLLTRPGSILELALAPIGELTLVSTLMQALGCARRQHFDAVVIEHRAVASLGEAGKLLGANDLPVLCIVEREQLGLVQPPALPIVRGPDLSSRIVDELRACSRRRPASTLPNLDLRKG